jgi:hypothetical protein
MPNKVGGNEELAAGGRRCRRSVAAACCKSALHVRNSSGLFWLKRRILLVLSCSCAPFSSLNARLFVGPTRRRVSHMQLSSPLSTVQT